MALTLPVQTGTVPANVCFQGFNSASWLDIVSLLSVTFPSDCSFFNFGNETPSPDKRDRPWIRLNSDGSPDRMYVYWNGLWVSRHTDFPGKVTMWEGTQASIKTLDGGEDAPVTATSGPFWEEVTEMQARSPIGPGVLPSSAVLAVGDTGGEEKHLLVPAELPKTTITIPARRRDGFKVLAESSTVTLGVFEVYAEGTTTPEPDGNHGGLNTVTTEFPSNPIGADTPHNNLHPYNAIYFIRRTSRLFYRV